MGLVQTANQRHCQHFVFFRVIFMPALSVFWRGSVFVLLNIKIFRQSTSNLFKVR